MGGHVSRTDFEWTYTEEPHASRRAEMLKKYPEIKKLMVVDQAFKYKVVFLVLLQFIVIYLVKDFSWGLTLLLAYTVAGVINHALLLAIHETSHNAAYGHGKPIQNKLFSIFTNLPIGVPCAISFKKYHLDHHKYMGNEDIDVDLPSDFEAHFFTNQFSKFIWVVCQGLFYSIRPLFVRPLPMQPLEALNFIVQIAFDIFIVMVLGPKSLVYMIAGSFMGMGLHPVAGHFISEHYMFKNGYETYSYYGPLNMVTFNVGYHNEHHDFPNIPGSLLPKVREIAPEYYNSLPSHDSWTRVLFEFIRDPAIGPYARIKRKNNLGKNYLNGNLEKNVRVNQNESKVTSNGLKRNGYAQAVNGDVIRESGQEAESTGQSKMANGHIELGNCCMREINGTIAGHIKSD